MAAIGASSQFRDGGRSAGIVGASLTHGFLDLINDFVVASLRMVIDAVFDCERVGKEERDQNPPSGFPRITPPGKRLK